MAKKPRGQGRGTAAGKAAGQQRAFQNFSGAILKLTGDKRLIKKLAKLRTSLANKAMRAGLREATKVIQKGIKAQVPADQKPIKQLIGRRVDSKGKGGELRAKVGAAVGGTKKKQVPRNSTGKSKVEVRDASGKFLKRDSIKRRGVGLSGNNIHWWFMGTAQRTTGSGHPTGAMPSQLPGIVEDGFDASKGEAITAMKQAIAKELAKA